MNTAPSNIRFLLIWREKVWKKFTQTTFILDWNWEMNSIYNIYIVEKFGVYIVFGFWLVMTNMIWFIHIQNINLSTIIRYFHDKQQRNILLVYDMILMRFVIEVYYSTNLIPQAKWHFKCLVTIVIQYFLLYKFICECAWEIDDFYSFIEKQ